MFADNKEIIMAKDDKLKALDAAIAQIEKQYGKGSACFCYTTFFQKVKSRTIGITIIYGKPMFFVKILVSARLPGASVL